MSVKIGRRSGFLNYISSYVKCSFSRLCIGRNGNLFFKSFSPVFAIKYYFNIAFALWRNGFFGVAGNCASATGSCVGYKQLSIARVFKFKGIFSFFAFRNIAKLMHRFFKLDTGTLGGIGYRILQSRIG